MSYLIFFLSFIWLLLLRCVNKKFNKFLINYKWEYFFCLCLLVSFNFVEDEDVGVVYFELFDFDLIELLFVFLFFYYDVEFNRMVFLFLEKIIFWMFKVIYLWFVCNLSFYIFLILIGV